VPTRILQQRDVSYVRNRRRLAQLFPAAAERTGDRGAQRGKAVPRARGDVNDRPVAIETLAAAIREVKMPCLRMAAPKGAVARAV